MIRVNAVQPGSLGDELGLSVGTELVSVNGRPLEDFLDWEFLTAEDASSRSTSGSPTARRSSSTSSVPQGMPMGLAARAPADPPLRQPLRLLLRGRPPRRACATSLYIRDDDYRLSFRYGNFATLTNLKQRDVDRIIEYRLSPLYVSVHATDPTVRRWLLRNPTAPDILEQLRGFAAHGIQFHTQIVMSPGVNDGDGAGPARWTISTPSGARCSTSRWCRSGSPSSASITWCASRPPPNAAQRCLLVERARRGAAGGAGHRLGLRRRRALPPRRAAAAGGPRRTTTSSRWRTASARCASCRRASGRTPAGLRPWRASASGSSPAPRWAR